MSTYNVEILNSCNLERQLNDTQSAIKNKPLPESTGFKFVTTLDLEFK